MSDYADRQTDKQTGTRDRTQYGLVVARRRLLSPVTPEA